ncbi:hypothetical protein [Methylobacterium soli]|uniref:Uncharacterized protein n=1 Tax=Methylobacterium soli TaxID=553447 RepID=A0A6L3SVN2_9HYPH|nr:hypothetical protein [Methylobacterium soli]KAB1075452.1 hypothetical protein F6X53_25145 [Methylobacterium soli]GJE45448.1 hypothetical protein AEGHOMDF_4643 [Methylobacterium soli]
MTGFLAVALVCASTVLAPDCSRENALDLLLEPVQIETECLKRSQQLAIYLSLEAGQYHKLTCQRRKVSMSLPPMQHQAPRLRPIVTVA